MRRVAAGCAGHCEWLHHGFSLQDVVADDDLAALFGDDDSSDNEDYDPSAAPQVLERGRVLTIV